MKRKLGLALLCLTVTTGIVSADDSITPGKKAPDPISSFTLQIASMWDSFLGLML